MAAIERLSASLGDYHKRAWLVARPLFAIIALLALVALGAASHERAQVWRSDLTLWSDTARKSPGIYKTHLNLGVAWENAGRLREAEKQYLISYRIWPDPATAMNINMVRAKMRNIENRK